MSDGSSPELDGLFDCHTHLTDLLLSEELDHRLAEAEAVGVTGIVTVSESLEDANQVGVLLLHHSKYDLRALIRVTSGFGHL